MRYRFLRFPEGKAKAVTLSYDDGCRQDERFVEILNRNGLKCTFNHNSDEMKKSHCFNANQVQELFLNHGHEIAVHGYWHRANGSQRPIDGIRDVLDNRLQLEQKLGIIIRGMAYPDTGISYSENGTTYAMIKQYLTELDIVYARTLGGDNNKFELPKDWHAWMPTAHHQNPKLMEYIDAFLAKDLSPATYHARRGPALFYLWGHSYEFDNNKNWDLAEEMCAKLGNKENIWYATNMEIYEYVTAYRALIYSADGTIVKNPTLHKIWFDIDGAEYVIAPGDTLYI